MLLKGSSAARAGRLLRHVDTSVARFESHPLAIRSLAAAVTPVNGRLNPLTASASVGAVRTFAERVASRPKAHTGRATATRKPRTTTTKAAARPSTTKKRATKAKPKPKPKPKKRVALTPEAKRTREIRNLKQKLLRKPKQLPDTAFLVISSEQIKGQGLDLKSGTKQASAIYRNLSPSEREHYNHIANENRVKNDAAYKRWVHSHPAIDVKRANKAGRQLVRLGARKRYTEVRDDRVPKKPRAAHTFFAQERFASGDMAGMPVSEAIRLIAAEYKQLSSSQQQKYVEESRRDCERYSTEIKRVYGS